MIVNHTYKFIFVHVPKAAGTSITSLLANHTRYRDQEIGGTAFGEIAQPHYWSRFGLRKHSSAHEIRRVIGNPDWESYYKFAFVRDPFARLVSAYHFLKQWDGLSDTNRLRLDPYSTAESFVSSGIWRDWAGPDNIFLPQARWVAEPENGEVILDFVGKIEDLRIGLDLISKQIGIELHSEQLKQLNKSSYESQGVVNDQMRGLVKDYYEVDYRLFGY